jgi:hypothetical protein
MSDRQITDTTSYSDSLIKLIPSEFIAAYLAIHNTVISTELPEEKIHYILLVCGAILLLFQPFYLSKALNVKNISQIIMSSICFIVWVISLGGVLDFYEWYVPVYSTLAIILWTTISPLLVSK